MTQTRQKPKGERGKGGYDFIRNGIDDYPLPTRLVYNFVAAVLWLFSSIVWPTRFEGLDELVDHVRERGTVIVMNHTSMVEPVVFIVGLWRRHVRVRPIYKVEFEKIGPAKWLLRRMGGIPVDRGSADLKALKAAQGRPRTRRVRAYLSRGDAHQERRPVHQGPRRLCHDCADGEERRHAHRRRWRRRSLQDPSHTSPQAADPLRQAHLVYRA